MASEGAYFTGRAELLAWINATLDLGLTKIEQTASGAVACQLMDALHPGSINMAKVDFNARSEVDCIANYKVLQAALDAAGIAKPVDVARLVQARPADNLAFMQWWKAHFDGVTGGAPLEAWAGAAGYAPAARRAASKTGDVKGGKGGGGGSGRPAAAAAPARAAGGVRAAAAARRPLEPVAAARPAVVAAARPAAAPAPASREEAAAPAAPPPAAPTAAATAGTAATASAATAAAAAALAAAERERDFYFSKLRAVELLVTGAPGVVGTPAADAVTRVLYAPDEAGAAAVLAEAGAPTGEEEGGEQGGDQGGEEPASPPPAPVPASARAIPPSPLVEGGGGRGRASVEAAMAGLAVSPPPAHRR